MFLAVAAFEFRQQTRRPIFWIAALLFLLFTFALVAAPGMSLVSAPLMRNSPAAFVQTTGVLGLLFVFMIAAFASDVVVRDDATGFGPIVRTTPVSKAAYLYGRFAGAFAAVFTAFLTVPAGFVLGSLAPWVDPEVLGPLRLWPLLQVFLVLAAPTLFAMTALCFAIATATRSVAGAYVAIVAFLSSFLTLLSLSERLSHGGRIALAVVEPLGVIASMGTLEYWTPDQLNSQAPALAGLLLANRAFVVGLGLAALAAAYALYRFSDPVPRRPRSPRREAAPPPPMVTAPRVATDYGARSLLLQTVVRTRFVFRWIVTSPAFLILLGLSTAFTVPDLWTANKFFDTPSLPVTRVLIGQLGFGGYLVGLVVATWYAGELVWLDRDRRVDELVDATGAPSWVLMLPKVLGVVLVLAAVQLTEVLTSVGVQAAKGWYEFRPGHYLHWHVLPALAGSALIAVMTVFLHALAPNKVVGWGLTLLFLACVIVAAELGFDHNLLLYGNVPRAAFSEMNGRGGVERAAGWFRLYWSAVAVVLMVIAYGAWRRGVETRLGPRLRRLPARLRGPAGLIGLAAFAAAVGLGAFIYVNTFVWNGYRTQRGHERRAAEYEKALLRFENRPQPLIEEVRLEVSIEPRVPRLEARGAYILRNATDAPLTHAHVRFEPGLRVLELSLEGAALERDYPAHNYRIFRFDRPLPPGGRRTLAFASRIHERGFANSGPQTRVVANGSFITNIEFAPRLGMDRSGLLSDPETRRRLGLPARLHARSLDDPLARRRNYAGADWVRADITVVTDADQTPVAPGRIVSEQTIGGRRSVRFRPDAEILNFFSIQSARYAVRRDRHAGIELAVFHHPGHGRNVDRMIAALKAGLDYAQANFSPYQFRQVRIVEFPAYGDYAQSFPQTIPYSENAGFVADLRRPDVVDYVTAVTVHELAHQWWGHQLIGADAEGARLLSETLADYTSLMVMEKLYGPDAVGRILRFDMDGYMDERSNDALGERPLVRVEDQPYLAYNKGAIVMYHLREVVGEAAVNRALRRLLRDHAFKGPPYPTSREFMAALRAETPPAHQQLLTRLFEEVGPPDLVTRPSAPASAPPDGGASSGGRSTRR